MNPEIVICKGKRLIGKRLEMSRADDRTRELWRSFMPERAKIKNIVGPDLYHVHVYDASYFKRFDPNNRFDNLACVEVTDFDHVPAGMVPFLVPSGTYAVFLHRGTASDGAKTFQYIFKVWLPKSDYEPDDRPHFELLGEKYKNDTPDSEEEIWVPIKSKKLFA